MGTATGVTMTQDCDTVLMRCVLLSQMCCEAVDKDETEAMALCSEVAQQHLQQQLLPAGGGALTGTDAAHSRESDDESVGGREGAAAAGPFRDAGGNEVGVAGGLGGLGAGGGSKGKDRKGGRGKGGEVDGAAGGLRSIYDFIHMSMSVWVGAALMIFGATLLLAKRSVCLPCVHANALCACECMRVRHLSPPPSLLLFLLSQQ
jgi:hypothetical protein